MRKPSRRGGPGPLSIALLALVLGSCAQAPRPAPSAGTQAAETGNEPAASGDLERALTQALARRSWNDLRIDTECFTEAGYRFATVFGSGAGIWNRERQLNLTRDGILSLLKDFEASGFPRMRETYGEAAEKDAALELVCRVRLELDGVGRQSVQLSKGKTAPELLGLAHRILAAAEAAGRSGPEASSLAEGLQGIAGGKLAPELLTLHVVRQSEEPGSREGWQLDLEGSRATLQRNPAPEGEAPRTFRLEPAEIAGLAGRLAAAGWEEMPANLWAPEYTDLQVQ